MSTTELPISPDSWDRIGRIPAAWFLVACSMLSISSNTVNIFVIPRVSDLADTSKVFYIALAIFDLMFTVLIIVMIQPSLLGHWSYGDLACKVFGSLAAIVPSFSSATVTLLNIDRFILIMRPLRYPLIVSRRRCVGALVLMCLTFVILAVIELEFAGNSFDVVRFREFGMCFVDMGDRDFLPVAISSYAISMWLQSFVLTILYIIVIRTARRHTKDIARQELCQRRIQKFQNKISSSLPTITVDSNVSVDQQLGMRGVLARKRKNLKSVTFAITVTGSYFVTWIPFSITEFVEPVFGRPVPPQVRIAFVYVLLCATWSNSLVYFTFNKRYRQEVWKMLKNLATKVTLTKASFF